MQARKLASEKSTLTLKPRAEVTRIPKQGYQWLHKKNFVFKILQKKSLIKIICLGVRKYDERTNAPWLVFSPSVTPVMAWRWATYRRCRCRVCLLAASSGSAPWPAAAWCRSDSLLTISQGTCRQEGKLLSQHVNFLSFTIRVLWGYGRGQLCYRKVRPWQR